MTILEARGSQDLGRLAICGALVVHVPVFYLLDRPAAYMITVVLVLGAAALWVTRTKPFSENLEWFRGR